MPRYTNAQFQKAIPGSGGLFTTISKRLGCDWATAKKRVMRSPDLRLMWEAEREAILDMSEAALIKAVQEGDTGTAKFILTTLGKDRGFTQQHNVAVDGGLHIVMDWGDVDSDPND